MPKSLGESIREFRLAAGYTLRGFAEALGISAAHQSDIEYGRRAPGQEVLRNTGRLLAKVGGSYEVLRKLDPRLDPDTERWMQSTPAVGELLRQVRKSGK